MTELIKYPTREAAIAALLRLRKNPDVTDVSLIENGKTLKVEGLPEEAYADEISGDPIDLGENAPADPPAAENAPETGAEPEESPEAPTEGGEPVEAQEAEEEDVLGDPPPVELPEGFDHFNRAQLREFIKDHKLGVKVPEKGPLADTRDAIQSALAKD